MLSIDKMKSDVVFANDLFVDLPTKMDEAENLMEEARHLLVNSMGALNGEGIRDEALALERWLESYRRGISAAQKLSKSGPELLEDMSVRMRHALEELHRFEEEGGNSATKSQQAQIEEINKALCAIQKLSDSLRDASFTDMQQKTGTR